MTRYGYHCRPLTHPLITQDKHFRKLKGEVGVREV